MLEKPAIITTDSDLILPYFRQYGDSCMAYTGLQIEQGQQYFFIDKVGYISFYHYRHLLFAPRGVIIGLANPVCDKKHYRLLLDQFIAHFKHVSFIQISRDIASILDDMGYMINQFGVETDLKIQHYDLKGKAKSSLRQWRNKCIREKVKIEQVDLAQGKYNREIKSLSVEWRKSKGGKRLYFLNRPFLYGKEKETRCFIAKQDEKILAVAVFDPQYKDGKLYGYYHNIDRIADKAPHGVGPFLILQAMDVFRKEGVELISLGMSPLHGLGAEFNYNKITRKVLRYSYKNMNYLYPLQGNYKHKKKFAGEEKRVYFCSTKGNRLWDVFLLMKSIGIY